MNPDFLATEESLTDFLESFERGTWPKSAWTHAAHVAVASCYLIEHPDEEARDHMRRGIRHYNQCVGTVNSDHSGYHETITLFWLAVVKARLRELADGAPRIEAVRMVVTELAPQRELFREYYSFDVVRSVEARRAWIAPDLKPLP
ncbi:MAG: hypothetical protein LAP39_11475 [Acidobacteriia bacterium]|nr:hypothetical protein [Terriglobia bacterium]